MNILLTAIGKRVQLIQHLKKDNYVIGVDSSNLAPAMYFVDSFHKVPRYDEKDFIDELLTICKLEKVDMLIPLYEKEFFILCDHRHQFADIGVTLLLSDREVIEICNNKSRTYEFFIKNKIQTPLSFSKEDVIKAIADKVVTYPLIIKPISGMGSQGVFKVKNEKELLFFLEYVEIPVIQEFIEGTEYTIDVLCSLEGEVLSIVPRERLEVRAGEVSKAKTVRHKEIIKETKAVMSRFNNAESRLKAIGPLNIQCIVTETNEIKFIEINPRFGGGVPLTFEAGVDYSEMLNQMMLSNTIKPTIGEFKEITMLRYDGAVFI